MGPPAKRLGFALTGSNPVAVANRNHTAIYQISHICSFGMVSVFFQIRDGVMVSISGSHSGNLGSIPSHGEICSVTL